jgi:hypothetical protein
VDLGEKIASEIEENTTWLKDGGFKASGVANSLRYTVLNQTTLMNVFDVLKRQEKGFSLHRDLARKLFEQGRVVTKDFVH